MTKTFLVTVTAIFILSAEFLKLGAQSEVPPAVFTEAQAAARKAAYESVCFNCHTYAVTGRKGDLGELPAIDSLAETYRNGIQQATEKFWHWLDRNSSSGGLRERLRRSQFALPRDA